LSFCDVKTGLQKTPLVLHGNGRFTKQTYITAALWKQECLKKRPDGEKALLTANRASTGGDTDRVDLDDLHTAPTCAPVTAVPLKRASDDTRSASPKMEIKSPLPYNGVEKIAFLFISRGPMPHEAIWADFFRRADPSKYIIRTHPPPAFAPYAESSVFYRSEVSKTDRVLVEWGGMSEVLATRALYREALTDPAVTYMVLLSESCLPLHGFSAMYSALLHPPAAPLTGGSSDPEGTFPFTHVRRSLINACPQSAADSKIVQWKPTLLEANITQAVWRKSEQWHALLRSHVEIIMEDLDAVHVMAKTEGLKVFASTGVL
jgi:hypothetical protein